MSQFYWGVDLGGTKIECAVMNTEDQCVLRHRIDTEGEQGYEHVIGRIGLLVNTCANELGVFPERVGFGTPGTLDPATGVMKNCNSTFLNGRTLDRDLEAELGVPVVLANDANCFALAETRLGVVKDICPDAQVVFGIIMGTGVGSGIVVHNQALYGCHGIAGEWGHNVIEAGGVACYCGKAGCVETVISGKGLEQYFQQQAKVSVPVPLQQIVAMSAQGEPAAQKTLERLYSYFGKAVAQVINILDPDVIVVGGGVGNIDSLYEHAEQAILPHLFNPVLNTRIVKPKLGDSAGVFGAAMLVKPN